MPRYEIGPHSISGDEIQDLLATDHPMVAQFRFEQTGRGRADGISFALKIIPRGGVRYQQLRDGGGHRIKPVWRTLNGSEEVGQGNRAIWLEGEELVAENCTFFPNQEFNDLGIGSALYVAMERFYRHLGIRRVNLLAVDIGVYVWARQGFAFNERGAAAGLSTSLRHYLDEHGAVDSYEPARFQESWDFANCDAAGLQIRGYRAGKAFMLDVAPPWYGVRHLDDPVYQAVAEASRRETFARLPDKIEGAAGALAVR